MCALIYPHACRCTPELSQAVENYTEGNEDKEETQTSGEEIASGTGTEVEDTESRKNILTCIPKNPHN